MSHLTVYAGPMFSAKSTALHRMVERALRARQRVDVVLHSLDTRSNGQLRTHGGLTLEALGVQPRVVSHSIQVCAGLPDPRPHLVVIEEAQFFDDGLLGDVEQLKALGIRVAVGGLDLTSEGKPFGCMPGLLALADDPIKLTAICDCGAEATRTLSLVRKTEAVRVGGADEYRPACFSCWLGQR